METCPTCDKTFDPIAVSELGQYGHHRPDGLDAYWHAELDCWANVGCYPWLSEARLSGRLKPGWSVVGFATATEALADD
jgi:hypothetical protein